MKVKDIAWLAGLVEGEGSFLLKKGSPSIQIQMTDIDVIDHASALFGVERHKCIYKPKGKDSYKLVYKCSIHGVRAIGWMMTILSFLGERRKAKATEIIMAWRTASAFPRSLRGIQAMALCHPNKIRTGQGLCRTCYMRNYRKDQAKVKIELPKSTVNVSPLPSVSADP